MELEIIEKRENPLLNRMEVKFRVKHQGEKTPERELVRSDLAELLKVKKSLVIVDYIRPSFGIAVSSGYAKIYKSIEDAKKIEPSYILKRNKFGEKKEEVEETKEEKKEEKVEAKKEETKETEETKEGKVEEKTKEDEKKEVKEEKENANP